MKYGKAFWAATAERTIATAAQTALGFLGAEQLGVFDVDWPTIGSVVAVASIAAVLKAVVAASSDGNPSLGSKEAVATPGATADPAGEEPVVVLPAEPVVPDVEPGEFDGTVPDVSDEV